MLHLYQNLKNTILKVIIFFRFSLLIFFEVIIYTKSQDELIVTFKYKGRQILYCDDFISFFNTTNLNVYKIKEGNNMININSKLDVLFDKNSKCKRTIIYDTSEPFETILIKFEKHPTTFKYLFFVTTIYSIKINSYNYSYECCDNMFDTNTYIISIDLFNFSFNKTKTLRNFCSFGQIIVSK